MTYDFSNLAAALAPLSKNEPKTIAALLHARRVFVYGAGRSGLMLKAFAMRLAQAGYTAYVVGETTTPAIERGDLLLLASASGSTASVCRFAQTARGVDADVCAITATTESPLAALCTHRTLLCTETKDNATSTLMGTVFEQALLLLLDEVVRALDADPHQMRKRHANLE